MSTGFGDIVKIPSLAVNGFLWDTMKELNPELSSAYGDIIPFYPIGDSAAGDGPWDNKPYFIYDRVFRFSSKPFYEHKRESTLYYLKATEIDSLEWSAVLQIILDREDDAAIDINNWIRRQWKNLKDESNDPENVENPYPFYFHNVRVYQSRSSTPSSPGKLREASTVQPYYITEFMIDTHLHFTNQLLRTKKQNGDSFDFEYKYETYRPSSNHF
jgi:hypothetical protein